MSHPFDEPLSNEERALADRLARLGPRDGPSPALDAKILAAAHAAVAPRRNRRWLALTGIPATLVTGVGMAAVLALAVGVVWQLRPSAPAPKAPRDESDFGYVTAEVVKRRESADAAAAASGPAPPPPPPAEAPVAARALKAPVVANRQARPARASEPAQDAPAAASEGHFLDEAVDAQHAHPAAAARNDVMPYSATAPAASAPAPAAPPPMAAPAVEAAEQEARQRAAAQAEAQAESTQRKAIANDDERARREQSARASAEASAKAPVATVAADAAQASGAAASEDTLDRIEVTGSQMSVADIPVRSDRTLAPDQWLQRIRERRDNGDVAGARESLALLRKAHPRLSLPDDLRALADPAP